MRLSWRRCCRAACNAGPLFAHPSAKRLLLFFVGEGRFFGSSPRRGTGLCRLTADLVSGPYTECGHGEYGLAVTLGFQVMEWTPPDGIDVPKWWC